MTNVTRTISDVKNGEIVELDRMAVAVVSLTKYTSCIDVLITCRIVEFEDYRPDFTITTYFHTVRQNIIP